MSQFGDGIPVEEEEPRTLTERAYRQIRSDIVWGILPAGAALRSDDLRSSYDIGVSPLREALTRLTAEKLVTLVGQRGFRVAPITARDVIDVMETRLVIERAALKRSIETGDINWETRVVAACHAMSRIAIPRSAIDESAAMWTSHHRAFHLVLLSACGSKWQMDLAGLLFDQAERFQLVRATNVAYSRLSRDSSDEHKDIMEAAVDRDFERAAQALEDHYRATTNEVLAFIAAADDAGTQARKGLENERG